MKRLFQTLLVLILVSMLTFLLVRLAPGNPARMMLPETASDEAVREMEIKMGLDRPIYEQYIMYVGDILHGDFGTSSVYRAPVTSVVATRLPHTLLLASASIIVGCCLCIPLGIIAGSNQGKPIDFFAILFALFGQSMSHVWLAVLNVFMFAVWLGWLPALGSNGLQSLILPALSLGYPMAAEITRIGRSGMIDTLREDYITATYARGMSRTEVNWKYAFKNALIPIITLIGIQFGSFLSGTVVVETVFAWPGIGQLMYQAISNRDYSLVQGLVLLSAFFFAIINLIVDLINSFIDPRIVLE